MKVFVVLIFSLLTQVCPGQEADSSHSRLLNLDMSRYRKLTTSEDSLILVNFNADWCIVCKKQKPILDALKKEHPEIKLLEIDMEENPLVAEYFEVDGLPVNILYKKGQIVWNRMGIQKKDDFENILWQYRIIKKTEK